ncbi:MAG: hypothetical protein K2X27_04410, partial [Candidatus Obscuribacterales bacterium]|nr:hypothetical protein [Candidatus Obscuribacterales bacterium]
LGTANALLEMKHYSELDDLLGSNSIVWKRPIGNSTRMQIIRLYARSKYADGKYAEAEKLYESAAQLAEKIPRSFDWKMTTLLELRFGTLRSKAAQAKAKKDNS